MHPYRSFKSSFELRTGALLSEDADSNAVVALL